MKVLISAKAKQDLLRTYLYLARRNPSAAAATLKRIDVRLEQLARFPFIGRERSSLAPALRGLLAGNHIIFYRVGDDQITVVRVIDSRMDIEEEFRR